jgi:hypothetical protein
MIIQIVIALIGGALAIGGVCALAKVGITKRKTHPGIAVAMIVVGLAAIGVAFFGLGPLSRLLGR